MQAMQQMQQQRLIGSQHPQQQFTQAEFDTRYMKPTQGTPVPDELAAAKAEIARLQAQIAAAQPLQHPTPAPTEPKPRPAIFRAIRQPAAMVVGMITEMRR